MRCGNSGVKRESVIRTLPRKDEKGPPVWQVPVHKSAASKLFQLKRFEIPVMFLQCHTPSPHPPPDLSFTAQVDVVRQYKEFH